jgi:hypothetical protein
MLETRNYVVKKMDGMCFDLFAELSKNNKKTNNYDTAKIHQQAGCETVR